MARETEMLSAPSCKEPARTPLPLRCDAYYLAGFLSDAEADALFSELVSGFDVADKRVRMFDGTEFLNETGGYLFTDPELVSFDALPAVWGQRSTFPRSLELVRDRITAQSGIRFPLARCIYYEDGFDGSDFHSDLPAYGSTATIASLSLGAEREFAFRRLENPVEEFSIRLASGSLLFMGEGCQELYEHALLRDDRCRAPRLNLTFRRYGWD
ncbi:MAG: alpha-ketoglutarate-dependent dioxygenase AlkB [Acidobacteria bacterium]|nr:alpha-ketoglutarate-dependent dioxygenase AlkB [Acidobacteriota bacterium]